MKLISELVDLEPCDSCNFQEYHLYHLEGYEDRLCAACMMHHIDGRLVVTEADLYAEREHGMEIGIEIGIEERRYP